MKKQILLLFFIFMSLFCFSQEAKQELFPFRGKNGKVGYINTKNKIVVEPQFRSATDNINALNYYIIEDENEIKGLVNEEGKFIIDFEKGFSGIFPLKKNLLVVVKNNKWGIINEKTEYKVPLIYDEIGSNITSNLILVSKKKKYGFINENGQVIIPLIYAFASEFLDAGFNPSTIAKVQYKNYFGAINVLNEIIVECQYDDVDVKYFPLIFVQKNKKWGMINVEKKILIDFTFDYLESMGGEIRGYNENSNNLYFFDKSGNKIRTEKKSNL